MPENTPAPAAPWICAGCQVPNRAEVWRCRTCYAGRPLPAGAPLRTIRRFMVIDPVAVLACDMYRHVTTQHPIAGLLDTVIEASGATPAAAWADLLVQARVMSIDVSPLLTIGDRFNAPIEDYRPDGYEPSAWLLDAEQSGGMQVYMAILLDTGAPADVPALLPFVKYIDAGMEIGRTSGPVTVEAVMVPRMAYTDIGGRHSETEIESLEPMRRVTLHPSAVGTSIDLSWGGATDEGYSHSNETITQGEDGDGRPAWEIGGSNTSRDCDGRMDRGWQVFSHGGPGGRRSLDTYPTMGDASPEHSAGKGWQRDHQAEAAGY